MYKFMHMLISLQTMGENIYLIQKTVYYVIFKFQCYNICTHKLEHLKSSHQLP